jgi:hypothetical protein
MKDYLYGRDLFEPVQGVKAKPYDVSKEKWVSMYKKTVSSIRKWIDHSIF